ncbi:MAG TPA: SRPBCC family protein [Pseudonocardia sp.]|jgi:uncharacterized protein YndB with AHSA1/START domain|nr:SRPBCC family protein [Pseudonocardia sp.]
MEWTGARYVDTPTVEVATWVDAPPERVWTVVSDVEAMPSMSTELQRVEWTDDATGPAEGACFVGYSRHDALGEWSTPSHVVECEEPRVFGWAVGDPGSPAASWRFTLEPADGGTRLTEWMRMGPGRSGLSAAIDAMPDKEEKIVFVRLREFEANMTATLAAIKERAEG